MINWIIFFILIFIGYFFGRQAEKKHFRSIIKREDNYRHLLTFSKRFPISDLPNQQVNLVAGNVVISVDYFKRIAAILRGLIGGRLNSYESLLDRARREAILRMKEDAQRQGMQSIVNVKLETSSITKGNGDQVGAIEVYAYGTGLSGSLD